MRILINLIAFTLPFSLCGQKKEAFYDYNWKPTTAGNARFYSTVEKTDSGWLRRDYYMTVEQVKPQMQGLYKDSATKIQHGDCIYFHTNGKPSTIGHRLNNKKDGPNMQYYSNGMIADSGFYKEDKFIGSYFAWHRNGYLADSIAHVNDSMDIHFSWFDDGTIAAAGYRLRGEQHGKWKYYHRNGNLAGNEVYDHGKVVSKEFFNEDNSPQPDTAKANRPASFKKGGVEGWRNYLMRSSTWPRGLQLVNTTTVTIGVQFMINEEGKPENIEVYVPFHPEFEKIAMDIIRDSPAWIPAMQHNRKVKAYYRQPMTFQQE